MPTIVTGTRLIEERPADDVRCAAEVPLPEPITDHRDTAFGRTEDIFGIQ